jgi:hypothetical protein
VGVEIAANRLKFWLPLQSGFDQIHGGYLGGACAFQYSIRELEAFVHAVGVSAVEPSGVSSP